MGDAEKKEDGSGGGGGGGGDGEGGKETTVNEVLLWLMQVDICVWEDAPQGVQAQAYRAHKKRWMAETTPYSYNNIVQNDFGSNCVGAESGLFITLQCVDTEGGSCVVQLKEAVFPLAVRIPKDFGQAHLPNLIREIAVGFDGSTREEFVSANIDERTPAMYYNHNLQSPTEPLKFNYVFFYFTTPAAAHKARNRLYRVKPSDIGRTSDSNFLGSGNNQFSVADGRVSNETNLLDSLNIPPSTWFSLEQSCLRKPRLRYTHCRAERVASIRDLVPRPDIIHTPPLKILSCDIEQYSHRPKRGYSPAEVAIKNAKARAQGLDLVIKPKRMFPNVDMIEDVVFSISSSTWWYGTERRERVVFLLLHASCPLTPELTAEIEAAMAKLESADDSVDEVNSNADEKGVDGEKKEEEDKKKKKKIAKQLARPPIQVRLFHDEMALFIAWRNHLVFEIDPDIVTGFNVDKFDYSRLCNRMAMLEKQRGLTSPSQFWNIGRYICKTSELKHFSIESNAMGQLEYDRLLMAGRVQLDLYYYFKKNVKLRKYSLNAITSLYLGHHKVDLDADTMCQYWSDFGTFGVDKLATVLVYNVVDSDLCLDLISFQAILANLVEMSSVCITVIPDLLDRGQQQKVYNQLVWYSRRWGYILNEKDLDAVDPNKKVKGATVLAPITRMYEVPVAVLDFGSLYPSIMKMMNLCYSTLINPRQPDPPPPATVHHIENHKGIVNRFVSHVDGILPRLLDYLLTARKKAKADKAAATDPMVKQVHEGRQSALKISANSVYGFTRAQKLSCPAVTESVTATGRKMLEQLKAAIEKEFNCIVIYGDTDSIFIVFRDIPRDRKAAIARVFELGHAAAEFGTRLFNGKVILEMEKVYAPMMMLAKKRYCGMRYMTPTEDPILNFSGVEPVQRSSFIFMAECYEELIDFVIAKQDVEGAIACLQRYLQQIVDDTVPFEKYIRSRELKMTLKSDEHEQVFVAQKVKERDPDGAYVSGDRVEYVFIETDDPNGKVYLKAEDPEYVLENPLECRIDRIHYIRRAFQEPICKFLGFVVHDPEKYFEDAVNRIVRQKTNNRLSTFYPPTEQEGGSGSGGGPKVRMTTKKIITLDTLRSLQPERRNVLALDGTMTCEEVSRTDGTSASGKQRKISTNAKRTNSRPSGGEPLAKRTKTQSLMSFMNK